MDIRVFIFEDVSGYVSNPPVFITAQAGHKKI